MSDLIRRQAAQPDTHDTNVGDATHKNVIYSPVQMAMDYAVNATDFSASSDTISRQDAIDALNGITVVGGRNSAVRMMRYIEAVRDRLKQLPSAQPTIEAVEVVRCRDCKFKQKCPTKIFGEHSDNWFCADGERRDPCSSQDS